MKHTLALVLMVFGLVGCNSTGGFGILNIEVSHKSSIWDTVIVEDYEDVKDCRNSYSGPCSGKAEAMSIVTGEKFHIGNLPGSELYTVDTAKRTCQEVFKSACVITRINQKVFFANLEDYLGYDVTDSLQNPSIKAIELRQAQNKKTREINLKNKLAREKLLAKESAKKEEEEKKRIIAELTQRCEEYGFTGESNISACIQREAQHDKELAMQKYELQKTRVALQQAQSQAQSRAYAQSLPPVVEEEEEVPWLIKFLGDVAIGVAEGYEHQAMHPTPPAPKQDIYRNCRPNC